MTQHNDDSQTSELRSSIANLSMAATALQEIESKAHFARMGLERQIANMASQLASAVFPVSIPREDDCTPIPATSEYEDGA